MKRIIAISMMFALLIQGLNPTSVNAAWEEFPTVGGLERETLIKTADSSAVYYFSINEQRYAFPDEQTFRTWYADFDSVQVIDQSVMDQIPYAGYVTVHPYAYMIQFYGETVVYVVDGFNVLQEIASEEVAGALFGDYWWHRIVNLPGSQKSLYTFGEGIGMEDVEELADARYSEEGQEFFGDMSIGFENVHFGSPDEAMMNTPATGIYIYQDPYRFAASDESVDCGESTCSYNIADAYEGGTLKFANRTEQTIEVMATDGSWRSGFIQPGELVIVQIERGLSLSELMEVDEEILEDYPKSMEFYLRRDSSVTGTASVELFSLSAVMTYAFTAVFGLIGN